MKNIHISSVDLKHVEEILPYVINFRKELFPSLDPDFVPTDLQNFVQNYIENNKGIFFTS